MMPFRFRPSDRAWESGFRRLACRQLDDTLDLIRANELPPEEIIHQIRRSCKVVRGLIRLMNSSFPARKAEDRAFRDIARELSGARDVHVLVDTLDCLVAGRNALTAEAAAALRARWLHEGDVINGRLPQQIHAAGEALLAARVRAESWYLTRHGDEAVLPGLQRSYRQAREALHALDAADAVSQASHEWRKQVKYHWQHMRLFRTLSSAAVKHRIRHVARLGDLLGARHDLDMLLARLDAEDLPDAGPIRSVANKRAASLSCKAGKLGEAMFAQDPPDFVAAFTENMRRLQ